jgi:hypothetical protein
MKIGDKYIEPVVGEVSIEILEIRKTVIVSKIISGPCAGVEITDSIEDFDKYWRRVK